MTETARYFPGSTRAAVVAALLVLLSIVTTAAGAAPPSQEDVQRAKHRLGVIEDALGEIRTQLAATQLRLNAAAGDVEQQEIALEKVTADLVRTQARLDRVRTRYHKVRARLNERAVSAYMTGPASNIDFLLDAQTVTDLTDRLAYVDALTQSDAELSVEVANQKNLLVATEAALEDQHALQLRQLEKARAQQQDVAALFAEQQGLLDEQERLFAAAERTFKTTKADRDAWLAQQQAAQGQAMGGRVWNGDALPEPYDHVLDACPVDQPRAFGDGFGAPRYAGGYHLHKGVDLVAPTGTEIKATFDGYAYTSSNTLGGSVVFVVGQYGKVYNAHLSKYSESSNGRVSAGDVIGYVGDSGDASGLPHDHFEFHPNSMPEVGSWPKSYYGFSTIEDAINPYPLLVQACG
jgi:murein DD-endopeptidase MepM/ murein hydrolase activator NlpD